MKIKQIISVMVLFITAFLFIPCVFASNIGRNVYGVFSETYNGAKYGVQATDDDAVGLNVLNANLTLTEETDSPRIEGSKYLRITTVTTKASGINFSCTNTSGYKNMSSYHEGYLKFYARASAGVNMSKYSVGLKTGAAEVVIPFTAISFTADGTWKEVSIRLSTSTNASFTSANMANITQLFLIKYSNGHTKNITIDIDNVVWVKNTAGSFTPSLKRISNDVSVTTITWNNNSLISNNAGWTASDQYIELDLDMYVTNKVWNVRIFTENGAINRNGLMSPSLNHKIPLCWRASDYKLPYSVGGDTRTLTIGETTGAKLYDAGAVPNPNDANYWCWFWMMDLAEGHTQDYNIIWDNRGFQSAENTGSFYGMNQTLGIYPRIYLGAKFLNVVGGQNYNATITAEFAYQ